ncbi:hypothetical protein ACFY93_22345 [Streptomyces sp. NPDC008313]|uniref:hypothetical protein n=1 Tax=Streptomyces sp. NPDC008313 TaxID=3364826 RepID=UPI0036E7E922
MTDTGSGTFRVEMTIHPDRGAKGAEVPSHDQQDVDGLRDEVQRVLSGATESDKSAKEVLKAIVDQVAYGFSDASYPNRDKAAQALKEAEKLARMAKHPDRMSMHDVAKFNGRLDKYHNDPLFAERFATRLGAKGTLQFWTEMTDAHAGATGADLDRMKSLQNNLSMTLATASFSDSDSMQSWKKDMLGEMNTSFHADPTNPVKSPVGALGSQVMSSLMHRGQFDTEFLDAYRSKVFKADKAAGRSNTKDLWETGNRGIDLVFGEANGRDPLYGVFDALSHNPEAAVHAFESKSDLNHMLDSTKYTDRGASLGQALETAVTGVAAGDKAPAALPHSETQVHIMANVMQAVAQPDGGSSLVDKSIGAHFGHMAASYMPEISRAFGGPSSEDVFLSGSADPAGLNKTDVTRFLSAVSTDANGRAAIRYGESVYTGSLIDAHLSDPALFDGSRTQVLEDIGRNAGVIEGIVGRSVADADIGSAVDIEHEENDALKQQGDFFKTVVSTGIGVGAVTLVPDTRVGAVRGAVGGGFFSGVAGMAVDRLFDGKELDNALDESLYRTGQDLNKMQESVNQQTQWSVEEALKRHHVDLPKGGTDDLIRNAVNDGWESSDSIMEDAQKRPSA